jgi:hypothetical protein
MVALPARHSIARSGRVSSSSLASESFVFIRRGAVPVFFDLILKVWRSGRRAFGRCRRQRDRDMLIQVRLRDTNLTCGSTEGILDAATKSGEPITGREVLTMTGGQITKSGRRITVCPRPLDREG